MLEQEGNLIAFIIRVYNLELAVHEIFYGIDNSISKTDIKRFF